MEKIYISANELLLDSFELAKKIYAGGFRPSLIISIWRGGAPVAIAIHEYMKYVGVATELTSISASSYTGINQRKRKVCVEGLDYIVEHASAEDHILLVDDVVESGNTVQAILEELKDKMEGKIPKNIKVAAPWYKPKMNIADIKPDFYVHETEKWLVFPHELKGLTPEELAKNKPLIADILVKHRYKKDIA